MGVGEAYQHLEHIKREINLVSEKDAIHSLRSLCEEAISMLNRMTFEDVIASEQSRCKGAQCSLEKDLKEGIEGKIKTYEEFEKPIYLDEAKEQISRDLGVWMTSFKMALKASERV